MADLKFPDLPTDGNRWTAQQHEQAVAAYLQAVANGDPDAGRLRTLIRLHGCPGMGIGPESGVTFKSSQ